MLADPWRRRALVFAVLVAVLLVFFRDALLSGLTLLYGDSYDGGIEVAILDHWYQVATHGAVFNVTGWFAPNADTLGYNDSYIVPGVFFTLARIAGLDPFLAALASHVAMKAIGFLGMYVLLRRGLAITTALALAGAALFATANASLLHMYHAQLLAIGLIPWLMLLAIRTVRAGLEDRRRDMLRSGAGFALLFGVAALNAFYQIWFLCMFALVFIPTGLLAAGRDQRRILWATARRHARFLAALAAIWAVAMLPFLLVYLPKLREGGGHGFDMVRQYLPVLSSYVNSGSGNLVWGRVLPMGNFYQGEHRFGFPLGLLALTIGGAWWGIRQRGGARMVVALTATLGILVLLMTRWTPDLTLWELVYRLVPGAGGVRVITRFLLFLLIPMIAAVMLMLDRWRAVRPVAVWAVIAFLLVEQVQLAAPLMLERTAQLRMLAEAGPPPAECDTFFVVSAREPGVLLREEADRVITNWGGGDGRVLLSLYRHNVDAMLLASYYGRPTINGYSTFNPPGWNLADADLADYPQRVRYYARNHPVGRLCGLDRQRSPQWFSLPYPATPSQL